MAGSSGLFEEVAGFHGFDVHQGVEEPERFLIIADWDSVEAHTAWQTAHAQESLGALAPFIDRPTDIRPSRELEPAA